MALLIDTLPTVIEIHSLHTLVEQGGMTGAKYSEHLRGIQSLESSTSVWAPKNPAAAYWNSFNFLGSWTSDSINKTRMAYGAWPQYKGSVSALVNGILKPESIRAEMATIWILLNLKVSAVVGAGLEASLVGGGLVLTGAAAATVWAMVPYNIAAFEANTFILNDPLDTKWAYSDPVNCVMGPIKLAYDLMTD